MADKITVNYGVKRSGSYQSVDVSVSVERDLAPGQTIEQAFGNVMAEIAPLVEAESMAAIQEVIRTMNT